MILKGLEVILVVCTIIRERGIRKRGIKRCQRLGMYQYLKRIQSSAIPTQCLISGKNKTLGPPKVLFFWKLLTSGKPPYSVRSYKITLSM